MKDAILLLLSLCLIGGCSASEEGQQRNIGAIKACQTALFKTGSKLLEYTDVGVRLPPIYRTVRLTTSNLSDYILLQFGVSSEQGDTYFIDHRRPIICWLEVVEGQFDIKKLKAPETEVSRNSVLYLDFSDLEIEERRSRLSEAQADGIKERVEEFVFELQEGEWSLVGNS